MSGKRSFTWLIVAAVCVAGGYYARGVVAPDGDGSTDASNAGPAKVDFIVGGPDDFYKVIIAGAEEAAEEFGVDLAVHIPGRDPSEQLKLLQNVSISPPDGLAISPIAPDSESLTLSRLATNSLVVTFDNDAPQSLRHCHVGTNNYEAGRACAKAAKRALPDGGKIAVFIGDNERNNARERRRGFYDELLDQSSLPDTGAYPPEKEVDGNGFTIVGTYLDDQNPEKAKANAEKALEAHPDLDGLIGLYGYNGPACLEVVREAEKLGAIKIVAFDEEEETLQGVADGHIHATVVQDPYEYGYESVRLLVTLHARAADSIPIGGAGTVYLPVKVIEQDGIEEHRKKLADRKPQAS
ncbi:MAG: substrate-binding domain-containing protein [Planctomycetota bacterium]